MDAGARLAKLRDEVREACRESGRDPSSVRILAVGKTKPWTALAELAAAGQVDFGENYVQEALDKQSEAANWAAADGASARIAAGIRWHFIGALQSNKAKFLPGKFSLVHSIDRLSLVEALEKAAAKLGHSIEVLIQVNVDDEAGKAGIAAAELPHILEAANEFRFVRICGLMCIPDPERETRAAFARLRELREQAEASGAYGSALPELSMGMTGDFREAIREGSTIVRIGTALFGAREKPA